MSRLPTRTAVAQAAWPPAAATLAIAGAALRASGRAPVMASAPLSVVPWSVPAGAALAAAAALTGRRSSAAALGVASAVVAAHVAPRMVARRQPEAGGDADHLRVMSVNVYRGAGDPDALLSHVHARRPDVLALQEQSPGYVRALVEAGIEEVLPYRVAGDGRRLNDPAIFARHPLEPLGTQLPGVFVGAVIRLPSGRAVPLISAHPLPPASPATERHWAATLAALPAPTGAFAGGIVAGDFNATLDHPAFRDLLRLGWRDAAAETGQGTRSTWTGKLGLLRMTIDHVLVPPGAAVRAFRVDELQGSDHRLLSVSLDLPAAPPSEERGRGSS